MIYRGNCYKGFIWNPSKCECDESWDVGEYLDCENFNLGKS